MENPGLAAHLEALLRHLASGGASEEWGSTALQQAAKVRHSAIAWRTAACSAQEAAVLRSVIERGADSLVGVLAQLRQQPPRRAADPRLAALHAACEAATACLFVGVGCHVSSEARLQLSQAGLRCLVSAGTAMLKLSTRGSWLSAQVDPDDSMPSVLAQLNLAIQCMRAGGINATQAAEAAPPEQFAAWLAAAIDYMKRLGELQDAFMLFRQLLPAFVDLCDTVLHRAALEAHAAAIHSKPPLAHGIVWLCLTFAGVLTTELPLPPGQQRGSFTWDSIPQVSSIICGPLQAALVAYMQGANSSELVWAITAAAQLVGQLNQPPPGCSGERHSRFLKSTVSLLGELCALLCDHSAVRQRLDSQQQRCLAQRLMPIVGALRQQLQVMIGEQQAADLPADEHDNFMRVANAACWPMGLVCALWQDACHGHGAAVHVQSGSPPGETALVDSMADAAAWCRTVSSVLQCVPLMQQLHDARPRLAVEPLLMTAALDLAYFAARQLALTAAEPAGRAAAAADNTLRAAAWQLHSHLARLVHWSAAADSPLLQLGRQQHAAKLLDALAACFGAALQPHRTAQVEAAEDLPMQHDCRQQHAICAAHAAALLACDAQLPLAQHSGRVAAHVLDGLAAVIGRGPAATGLDPAWHQRLRECWDRVAQQERKVQNGAWMGIIGGAELMPRLAAVLAAGSYLDELYEYCEQDAALAAQLLPHVLDMLDALRAEAEAAHSSQRVGVSPATADEQEAAQLLALRQAAWELHTLLEPRVVAADSIRQDVLPPARRLAAALLDWWRRPSAQQEQQLEEAQAAALRSCAYLRCANLGGGSGPAAGQGEGSQRCSACHAAWYCGTGCSHADWRAGHKRACKALGAARAAEKAARRQAAGAAGQEQAG